MVPFGADKSAGGALLALNIAGVMYYTLWVIVLVRKQTVVRCSEMPLAAIRGAEPPVLSFFPEPYWAIAIPTGIMVIGVTVVGTLLGVVMLRSAATLRKA